MLKNTASIYKILELKLKKKWLKKIYEKISLDNYTFMQQHLDTHILQKSRL